MKGIKIVITFLLLLSTIGCKAKQKNVTQGKQKENPILKEVPKYKYPDEFFNYNFSKDEKGNIYFQASLYFYQLDQQYKLRRIFYYIVNKKYQIHHMKYYNGQFYCLVENLESRTFGLATIALDGNNFHYISDLVYNDDFLSAIYSFRIMGNHIYLLSDEGTYTYSLDSNTIINFRESNLNVERYIFYKGYFPDFPYTGITHIYNNNFYKIHYPYKKERELLQYDPISKTEKTFNLERYYDNNRIGAFSFDLIDDHWFLYTNKGVFMFDIDFSNERQILDKTIFDS